MPERFLKGGNLDLTTGGSNPKLTPAGKALYEHQQKDPGCIHIFFVNNYKGLPGVAVSADEDGAIRDVREEYEFPGRTFVLVSEMAYRKIKSNAPRGDGKKERTEEESLAETIAHELGHALGLPDIDAKHIEDAWFNLMWSRVRDRIGTRLGPDCEGQPAPGDFVGLDKYLKNQRMQARTTAQGLNDIKPD